MTTIDHYLDGSATLEEAARDFIQDPLAYFDMSYTKMHTVPRDRLEELQTEVLRMRFQQQRERIPALAKLADSQGITEVSEFNDVTPLCFEAAVFKSYPGFLLESGQFDKLTTWLNRLTVHDLSQVDASGCDSIHSWLDLLCAETEVDPIATSGSTGSMSFSPRDKSDWRMQILGSLRLQLLQEFGKPPSEADLNEKLHVCLPSHGDGHTSLFRMGHYLRKYLALDSDDHFHPVFDTPGDTDVMYLAAQVRAAESRGDNRVNVLPSLLARRSELGATERDRPAKVARWLDYMVTELKGKRVFLLAPPPFLYDCAQKGLATGSTCEFAPNSVVYTGGNTASLGLPDDWLDVANRFFNSNSNLNLKWIYGFNELTPLSVRCEHGRYHIVPWSIPLILDTETNQPLPREGVQVGRGAFFDLAINGVWGGIVSGDKVEIDWNECPCGRTSPHLADNITRFGQEDGGGDKITCAATPQAHTEALDFLTTI